MFLWSYRLLVSRDYSKEGEPDSKVKVKLSKFGCYFFTLKVAQVSKYK